ncbi:MAG: hypothetical protein ACOYKZ_04115 [Chlamydiia bacterium]
MSLRALPYLPDSLLAGFPELERYASKIRRARRIGGIALGSELIALGLTTYGLASPEALEFAWLGILMRVAGGLCASVAQNRAGAAWSLALQTLLGPLRSCQRSLHALLVRHGLSDDDLQTLSSIPQEVYQLELQGYPRQFLLSVGAPVACGIGLIVTGQFGLAAIVILLGLLAMPVGEFLYRRFALPQEVARRLAVSAQMPSVLDGLYRCHQRLVFFVNLSAQLPLLLFAGRIYLGPTLLLSSFWALSQGLAGLGGMLAFQRLRAASQRSVERVGALVRSLEDTSLLVTNRRWMEHLAAGDSASCPDTADFRGVVLDEFTPRVASDQSVPTPCFSARIPAGAAAIVEAPSGSGKSVLLLSLRHLLDHVGELVFCDGGVAENAHQLTREQLDERILHVELDALPKGARIVDLFSRAARASADKLNEALQTTMSTTLVDLAWQTEDVLLQAEIATMRAGGKSLFPSKAVPSLIALREWRCEWVQSLLNRQNGHLGGGRITALRNIGSLSSGERQSLIGLLTLVEAGQRSKLALVVLDEPLAHLDAQQRQVQMERLVGLTKLPRAPALLVITHGHAQEIAGTLPGSQVITRPC